MASPSFPYSCPPPPYSHPPIASTAPPGQATLISPPESRRTSGDDAAPIASTRQSLPSIHEALGGADPVSYQSQASAPATSAPLFYQSQATSSVPDHHRPSYTPTLPPQQESRHAFSQAPLHSPSYMNRSSQSMQPPQTPTTSADSLSRPPYPHHPPQPQPKLPTLQPIRTGATSPVNALRPNLAYPPQQQSPSFEPASGPRSAPIGPPYGFTPFQPQSTAFTYSHPHENPSSMYPNHTAAPLSRAPSYPASTAWRREEDVRMDERQAYGRPAGMPYVESVKRHLDNFDLEASLNEIAECSGRLLDFTHQYGSHAHGNQRAGQSPQSIPQLQTVDDLVLKSRKIQESLFRIRDVVIAQTAAMEEQSKDNRNVPNGFAPDANGYSDEGKGSGGFAGSDTKKRRGRAAPPGRCHSCNRAETPEWRRGPDGARTLCNACGLHYAKLTRKLGTNKSAIGNSNLRPKDMGAGSPPA